jgi:hypothetical protein
VAVSGNHFEIRQLDEMKVPLHCVGTADRCQPIYGRTPGDESGQCSRYVGRYTCR